MKTPVNVEILHLLKRFCGNASARFHQKIVWQIWMQNCKYLHLGRQKAATTCQKLSDFEHLHLVGKKKAKPLRVQLLLGSIVAYKLVSINHDQISLEILEHCIFDYLAEIVKHLCEI